MALAWANVLTKTKKCLSINSDMLHQITYVFITCFFFFIDNIFWIEVCKMISNISKTNKYICFIIDIFSGIQIIYGQILFFSIMTTR